ncbi:protein of Ras GTPase family [Pseudohyphozyma bogoriensis]|nr:protein of Ras GTPase family [Pseudohyphozyma bogoriensis]
MASTADKGKGKADAEAAPSAAQSSASPRATSILVIGMAGSGKTTFLQRCNSYLHSISSPPYVLNLDPAVTHLPFDANIDIRDTVDYQEVMKQYNLGPNGGILTALNLFTTKFDQVLGLVEKRAETVDHVIIDTPGQIEIFTWSASGAIITSTLSTSLPTCIAYIVDTPRTSSPTTFMSNMLYACSILYKTRLPFILVFNKIDVRRHEEAVGWMRDFESFQEALLEKRREEGEGGVMDGLMNSMSLVLEEFYRHLRAVGVSAMTGEGMEDFFEAVKGAREEYATEYKPTVDKRAAQRKEEEENRKKDSVERLMKDMTVSGAPAKGSNNPVDLEKYLDVGSDEEQVLDDDEDAEIIDKSARNEYYDLPTKGAPRGVDPFAKKDSRASGRDGVVGDDGTLWPAP